MLHRLAFCLVIASLSLAAPRPADAANVPLDTFDTVDAIDVNVQDSSFSGSPPSLTVTGLRPGDTTPVTRTYQVSATAPNGVDAALHCHRLGVLVMSKPGKYQFSITGPISTVARGCKLTLVTQ